MHDLTLKGVTTQHVISMGDGLVEIGAADEARALYASALRREPDLRMRFRLRMRMGMLATTNSRTLSLFRLLKSLEGDFRQVFVADGMATWMKTIPFLDDERFLEIEARHAHLLPIANWHWNLQTILWAVQKTQAVEGDLVELGVFRGHTTLFAADYLDFGSWPKRWRLFDTFDGIPADQQDPGWEKINKVTYDGKYSYEEVVARFAPFPNIDVIRGRVPEILHAQAPERISFLHIDLNNVTAEIAALELLVDRLSPGAVLVLDDYCWESTRAQFDAERAWFSQRGLHVLPLPTGQGVFVKA